jgi:hypothetical protein
MSDSSMPAVMAVLESASFLSNTGVMLIDLLGGSTRECFAMAVRDTKDEPLTQLQLDCLKSPWYFM